MLIIQGELKPDQQLLSIQSIIAYCLERIELRDEIFCQLIRQTTNNPKVPHPPSPLAFSRFPFHQNALLSRSLTPQPDAQLTGWRFLAICCTCFPPGKLLYKYLLAYIKLNLADSVIGPLARYCMTALRKVCNR